MIIQNVRNMIRTSCAVLAVASVMAFAPSGIPAASAGALPPALLEILGASGAIVAPDGSFVLNGEKVTIRELVGHVVIDRAKLLDQQVRSQTRLVEATNKKLENKMVALHQKREECVELIDDDVSHDQCEEELADLMYEVDEADRVAQIEMIRLNNIMKRHEKAFSVIRQVMATYQLKADLLQKGQF
jgi:ATP-dependent Lon protease